MVKMQSSWMLKQLVCAVAILSAVSVPTGIRGIAVP